MTYQCDARLGSPALVDFEKMRDQGLGRPGAGTVDLGPGKTKIFPRGRMRGQGILFDTYSYRLESDCHGFQ